LTKEGTKKSEVKCRNLDYGPSDLGHFDNDGKLDRLRSLGLVSRSAANYLSTHTNRIVSNYYLKYFIVLKGLYVLLLATSKVTL